MTAATVLGEYKLELEALIAAADISQKRELLELLALTNQAIAVSGAGGGGAGSASEATLQQIRDRLGLSTSAANDNDVLGQVKQSNVLLAAVRDILKTQREFSSVIVHDSTNDVYYERRTTLNEETGNSSTQYYTLNDPANAVTLPTTATIEPGSGATTGNTVAVDWFEGTGVGAIADGALVVRIQLIDPSGVPLGGAVWRNFAGAAITAPQETHVREVTGSIDQTLQSILQVAGSRHAANNTIPTNYATQDISITELLRAIAQNTRPSPIVTTGIIAAQNGAVTQDVAVLGVSSHSFNFVVSGLAANETLTLELEGFDTVQWGEIGENSTFVFDTNGTYRIPLGGCAFPQKRVRCSNYNTAAGQVAVTILSVSGGNAS